MSRIPVEISRQKILLKKVKKKLKDQWNKGWSQNLIMIGTLIQQAKAKSVRAVHIYNTAYMILAISFSLHKVPLSHEY